MTHDRPSSTVDLSAAQRRRWDVIVIGAGPAGAMAAHRLAQHGVAVLLVDKAAFPRDKPCGGCINPRAMRLLERVGLKRTIDRLHPAAIDSFELIVGPQRMSLPLGGGVALSRSAFDAALADAAIDRGAAFLCRASVMDTESDASCRRVRVHHADDRDDAWLTCRLVLDAGGLGGALRRQSRRARASYIGLHAVQSTPSGTDHYPARRIHMAASSQGYVGLVRLEDQRLNIAAAIDPELLRQAGSPAEAVEHLLAHADAPHVPGMNDLRWKGTRHLTCRAARCGEHRLLRIGDAAGYVEPFTGEGIEWALASALRVAPIAMDALHAWDDRLVSRWRAAHRLAFAARHRRCRMVSAALRRPRLVRSAMRLMRAVPTLGEQVTRWVHAAPSPGPTNLLNEVA